jgi:hypothetical protein
MKQTNRRTCFFFGPALLAVQLLLSGCFTTGNKAPEWVTNPKSVYPESEFLATVGEGDTRQAAENAADAKLSRIFESRIESDERLSDQVHETNTSFERSTEFTSDINILSAQTLFNVKHAEAWKDKLGRYHAVAYIHRRETAEIYRDKINKQTSHVNFLRASAEQTDDLLKKYAILRAANQHAWEADQLLRQLKVIHPRSVPDMTPSYTINQLKKSLADTAKQIKVQIDVDGDSKRRMAATLEEFITSYGFVLGKPAVLNIDAEIDVSDTGEREQELVFVRYELQLRIQDAEGNGLVSVRSKGREAHKTLDQARTRSLRTLEDAIEKGGAQRLDAYFDSLVDQSRM